MIASKAIHGLTADRTEFIGRGGTPAFPAALCAGSAWKPALLPGKTRAACCSCISTCMPGGSEEIYFVLGQGQNREHALALAAKYHDPAYVGAAWERTRVFWDRLLGTVQVHTPEPATDLMLNRWLLYQIAVLPHLGTLGLLPVQRRIRFPRPAAGYPGAAAH